MSRQQYSLFGFRGILITENSVIVKNSSPHRQLADLHLHLRIFFLFLQLGSKLLILRLLVLEGLAHPHVVFHQSVVLFLSPW